MGHVIGDGFFKQPDWVEKRGTSRTYHNPATWWGSPDARMMNERTNGLLFKQENSPYSLGFDFLQAFSFKDHSVGVVLLRCEDHDDEMRAKRGYHRPLMILPGNVLGSCHGY